MLASFLHLLKIRLTDNRQILSYLKLLNAWPQIVNNQKLEGFIIQ